MPIFNLHFFTFSSTPWSRTMSIFFLKSYLLVLWISKSKTFNLTSGREWKHIFPQIRPCDESNGTFLKICIKRLLLDGYFSPQWLHIEMRGELAFFLKSKWHEIISPKNYGHGHCNETPLSKSAGGQAKEKKCRGIFKNKEGVNTLWWMDLTCGLRYQFYI